MRDLLLDALLDLHTLGTHASAFHLWGHTYQILVRDAQMILTRFPELPYGKTDTLHDADWC